MVVAAVRWLMLVLAVMTCIACSTHAQSQLPEAGRIALVIGNAAYLDHPLRTPVNDARAVAQQLRRLGFQVITRENARRQEMLSGLNDLAQQARPDGIALVYYAGHAVQMHRQNYLLPVDTRFDSTAALPSAAIALGTVIERLGKIGARAGLVTIDASYENAIQRRIATEEGGVGLASIEPAPHLLVAFSAAPNAITGERPGDTSAFADALTKTLEWPGLPANTLFGQVRTMVRMATGDAQSPWVLSSLANDVVLNSRVVTASPPRRGEAEAQAPAQVAAAPAAPIGPTQTPSTITSPPKRPEPPKATSAPQGKVGNVTGGNKQQKPPPAAVTGPTAQGQQGAGGVPFVVVTSNARSMPQGERIDPRKSIALVDGERAVLMDGAGRTISLRGPWRGQLGDGTPDLMTTLVGAGTAQSTAADPPAKPTAPAAMEISRYPTMEAPTSIAAGDRFEMQVWLTEDAITPDVIVTPGEHARVGPMGQLTIRLPNAATDTWRIGVVLSAPGFELIEGGKAREITLRRTGDSTAALFSLRALGNAQAPRQEKLRVTLWHEGQFIAQIARDITVAAATRSGAIAAGNPAPLTRQQRASTPVARNSTEAPDLTIHLLYDNPGKLGGGQLIVASQHFSPPSELIVGRFETPIEAQEWLDARYSEILIMAEAINTAAGDDVTIRNAAMLSRIGPMMSGFGRELYRRFAPPQVKDALKLLSARSDVNLRSIQIFTNNPILPWEVMRPDVAGNGKADEYLGISYRVARWHIGDDRRLFDRPPQQLAVRELAAVAPRYDGKSRLAFQSAELEALRNFPGFRTVDGRLASFRQLVEEPPDGIFHFSGHGTIERASGTAPSYQIGLEDGQLNLTSWRGMAEGRKHRHPLFFFNACQVGQADAVAGFVDGWAPAVLESGASGYVGALWPLFDRSAAEFSQRFYAKITKEMAQGPASIAEALGEARRLFYETGDPTHLAYAFYGDVNLRIVAR